MDKPYHQGRYTLKHAGNDYVIYVSKYNNRIWLMVHSVSLGERIVEENLLDYPTKEKIIYYIDQYGKPKKNNLL